MKKLLLAIYIIFVVTASLASRAETVPPVVLKNAKFEYNQTANVLRMIVRYPNPCVRQARLVLVPSEYENAFYVVANATRVGVGCIQPNMSTTDIEVTDISARALKFELQRLQQNLEGTYTIMSRDGSFVQTIDFAKLDTIGMERHREISGIMLNPGHNQSEPVDVTQFIIESNTSL